MALIQMRMFVLYLVLGQLLGYVFADINYGDCSDSTRSGARPRSQLLEEYLREAQNMANVTARRLANLNDFLRQETIPHILNQPDDELISTFKTYSRYVDGRVEQLRSQQREARAETLWGLQQVLGRSYCLRDNLAHALSRPVNKGGTGATVKPNINFQCSDNWIGPSKQDLDGKLEFNDTRSEAQGGRGEDAWRYDELLGGDRFFPLADDRKPFTDAGPGEPRVRIFTVNDLRPPFPSVVSINPRDFSEWNLLGSSLGRSSTLADRVSRGEDSFAIMRKNNTIPPGTWHIEELTKYHASSELLAALGESKTMANFVFPPLGRLDYASGKARKQGLRPDVEDSLDKWSWPPLDHGEYTLNPRTKSKCHYDGQNWDPNSWKCVIASAQDTKKGAKSPCNRQSTNEYLMIALYLNKYDWSSGYNQPVTDLRESDDRPPSALAEDPDFEEVSFGDFPSVNKGETGQDQAKGPLSDLVTSIGNGFRIHFLPNKLPRPEPMIPPQHQGKANSEQAMVDFTAKALRKLGNHLAKKGGKAAGDAKTLFNDATSKVKDQVNTHRQETAPKLLKMGKGVVDTVTGHVKDAAKADFKKHLINPVMSNVATPVGKLAGKLAGQAKGWWPKGTKTNDATMDYSLAQRSFDAWRTE